MIREDSQIFQGMKRGRHPIKQEKGFLWDAHNIRITNKEDDTLFSITNEKGTSDPLVTLKGKYVGHCVVNDRLIVFTSEITKINGVAKPSNCRIYEVSYSDDAYASELIFQREGIWEEGWSPLHPIETLGVYESSMVQKVYWVDGVNQPRVINIAKQGPSYNDYSFDFVQTLSLEENIKIKRLQGQGLFVPGTIQYAFTYYNKYGQESNIFYTTPLQYITYDERGENPEKLVSNSFQITVDNLDTNFEYIRIYSIHRSSIDASPSVRLVTDIKITENKVSYIDSGVQGETVDPQLLMYIGGREITASTMESKDNHLFFGNIKLLEGRDWNIIKERIEREVTEWRDSDVEEMIISDSKGKFYNYLSTIDHPRFKSNETYRCGIQFQHRTGIWSEPIHIKDLILNEIYPGSNMQDDNTGEGLKIHWHSKGLVIPQRTAEYIRQNGYIKARACVVFPSRLDRDVVCQGIINPTVFNVQNRYDGIPYSVASWMFRPTPNATEQKKENAFKGSQIEWRHNRPLFYGGKRGAEIQTMSYEYGLDYINDVEDYNDYPEFYFVDSNIVTLHSPEVEFDEYLAALPLNDDLELKVLGDVTMDGVYGDINIQTSTPARRQASRGFLHTIEGYNVGDTDADNLGANGGLVSGLFYNDVYVTTKEVDSDDKGWAGSPVNHLVYLWHRTGSVNNDSQWYSDSTAEDEEDSSSSTYTGPNSAILKQKIISNLKYFETFTPASKDLSFKVVQPRIFNSEAVTAQKVWVPYLGKEVLYYGNLDTLVLAKAESSYYLYKGGNLEGHNSEIERIPSTYNGSKVIYNSSNPVRIRYKSSPHLVFSLSDNTSEGSNLAVIPTRKDSTYNSRNYVLPKWDYNSKNRFTDKDSPSTGKVLKLTRIANKTSMSRIVVTNQVGTFRYCYDNREDEYYKSFIYCAKEGTNDGADSGTYYPYAKEVIQEGTIFKIVGDNSCYVDDECRSFFSEDTEIVNHFYKGPTLYYKAINLYYNDNKVHGDLQKLDFYEEFEEETPEEDIDKDNTEVQESFKISQSWYTDNSTTEKPSMVLVELRRKSVATKFGGDDDSAKRANVWLPAGDPILLNDNKDTQIDFKYGDTWYSRYDCLKTYPYANTDLNQVVEIGSFMCETRINIDGRYDKNRGMLSNLATTPQNFNLLNDAYSQSDNFFNYKILDEDFYKNNTFGNQLTWSLEKSNAADVDNWTKVTLANTIDIDGTKGRITALKSSGANLLYFQEKAFGQVVFNSRVQIPVSDGVPIEITNSAKMERCSPVSENIGCIDKWSIVSTDEGVYFIDNRSNSLYLYKDQVQNISRELGMEQWFIHSNTDIEWNPQSLDENSIRTFLDIEQGDIYLSQGPVLNKETEALCFSEKLKQFTSFMSYGGVQAMFNFKNGFYSLKDSDTGLQLYKNNAGPYNKFFGKTKGWDFSFVSNAADEQNMTQTKVFDTVEIKADHYNNLGDLLNTCPINLLGASNEYQKGITAGQYLNMRKKFRVWRGLIPRVSEVADTHNPGKDTVRTKHARARLRNPWAMITLGWNPEDDAGEDLNKRAIIHDVTIKYTV